MTAPSLLIAYDGSPAAESAVRAAGALFPHAAAALLTARREPLTLQQTSAAARIALPDEVIAGGIAALNRAAEQEADAIAGKGARTAVDAGLAAEARIVAPGGSPWCGIRRVAVETAAELIVCGSRGLGDVYKRQPRARSSRALRPSSSPPGASR